MRKVLTIMALGTALLVALPVRAEESQQPQTQQHAGQRPGGGQHRPGEMLRRLDKNGDGAVSREEFMAGATERFAKMDRNGDGVLNKDDRPEGAGPGGGQDTVGGGLRERLRERRGNAGGGSGGGDVVPDVTTE